MPPTTSATTAHRATCDRVLAAVFRRLEGFLFDLSPGFLVAHLPALQCLGCLLPAHTRPGDHHMDDGVPVSRSDAIFALADESIKHPGQVLVVFSSLACRVACRFPKGFRLEGRFPCLP